MSAGDWIGLSATGIAAGALVVSIISLVRSSRTERRQAKLEEEQSRLMKLQIAEHERVANDRAEAANRAKLTVALEPGAELGSWVVVVRPHPDFGMARSVAIVPKDRNGQMLPVAPERGDARIDLEPGDEYRLRLRLPSLGKGDHILVEVEWIDPNGEPRREIGKAYRRYGGNRRSL